MKQNMVRRLIAWARGEPRYTSNEQRRAAYARVIDARIDDELKKPVLVSYGDGPRADDLKALGLKESDFDPQDRSQKAKIK